MSDAVGEGRARQSGWGATCAPPHPLLPSHQPLPPPPPMLAWSGVGGLGVTEDETPALSSSAHEGLSGTILPGRGALHTLPSLPQQRNL